MVLSRREDDRPPVPLTAQQGRGRIRVLQLADLVNRDDFIDVIVEHADRERFDVRVATFGVPSNIADPGYAARGVEVMDLAVDRGRRSYPAALRRLVRYLLRQRIDIVHTHHFDPAVLGWLATRLPSTRLVVGRHYSDSIYLATSGAKRWAHLFVERRTYHSASAVVVPSKMIAGMVARAGVPAPRVHIVPYAFASQKYDAATGTGMKGWREQLGLPASAFIVGTFGHLHPGKGHRYLLEAIGQVRAEVPHLLWLVVGDGGERDALERTAERTGLREHVRFTGWRDDAMALMAGVDIVVQPSLSEAFSSVMGEAMRLSRPLVISDVSGATDVIVHGETGLIVPKRDPGALADAIRRLVADRTLRNTLGKNGHEFVTTRLTTEQVIPQYESVYEAVLNS